MAGSIKGITVEIGGNTTKLGKALNDVNTQSRNLQKELRGVNTLLKYDPSNVVLIKQKQDLLNTSIAGTKEKLNKLKEAQVQVQEQFDKGEITEEQYRDFQREIVATEQKLKNLEAEAKNFGSTVSASIISANEKLKQFGTKTVEAGKKMLPVTAAVGALGAAGVKTAADFESAMSQVAATMGMTADEINNGSKEYKKLEDAAREMGATTMFSASQAAEALNYLALAGYDTERSIATLPTILNVAASGGMELAAASDLVTDAMSALGDKAGTVEQFGDMLAKTSQKSNTSVAQLGEAILTVGGTAKTLKGGMAEASTAIGILSDNGIKASEAGTALRNVILNLAHPRNNAAAGTMERLGLSAWDAEGNMRPLNEVLIDLNRSMAGMSSQEKSSVLSTIFNKVDLKSINALLANTVISTDEVSSALEKMGINYQDVSGEVNSLAAGFTETTDKATFVKDAMDKLGVTTEQANTLYDAFTKSLADGSRWDELNGYINDAEGAASDMADTMQNNLNGQITALKSAIEGILISIGNALLPTIKKIVSALQNWAEWFNGLSESSKNIIVVLGLIAGAIGPLLLLLGNFALKLSGLIDLGIRMAPAFAKIGSSLKGLFGIIAAHPIIAVITAIVAAVIYLWNTNENFRNAVINIFNNVVDFISSCVDNIVKFFTETVPNALQNMCTWFSNLPGTIGTFLSNLISSIGQWLSQLPYNIGLWLGMAISTVINWGAQMKSKAVEIGSQFVTNAINFIKNLPSRVVTWLVSTYSKVTSWGSQMKSKATQVGSQFVTGVVNFIKNLPSRVATWFTSTVSKAVSFASNFASKGRKAATDFSNKLINGVKSIPSKIASIGKSIVEGLWRGISGAGSWLKNKITGFANSVVQGFKDGFKINSPAKVMIPIGRGIDEGVGLGIEDNADIPIESAQKVIDGVVGVNFERSLNSTFASAPVQQVSSNSSSIKFPENCTFNLVANGKTLASVTAPFLDILNGERLDLTERGLVMA